MDRSTSVCHQLSSAPSFRDTPHAMMKIQSYFLPKILVACVEKTPRRSIHPLLSKLATQIANDVKRKRKNT
jgi:hypothetical protein